MRDIPATIREIPLSQEKCLINLKKDASLGLCVIPTSVLTRAFPDAEPVDVEDMRGNQPQDSPDSGSHSEVSRSPDYRRDVLISYKARISKIHTRGCECLGIVSAEHRLCLEHFPKLPRHFCSLVVMILIYSISFQTLSYSLFLAWPCNPESSFISARLLGSEESSKTSSQRSSLAVVVISPIFNQR